MIGPSLCACANITFPHYAELVHDSLLKFFYCAYNKNITKNPVKMFWRVVIRSYLEQPRYFEHVKRWQAVWLAETDEINTIVQMILTVHFNDNCTVYACTHLTLHRVSVDLAHVLAAVLLLDALDVKVPGGVVAVGDGNTRVVRDHVLVNRLDRLRVRLYPAHLSKRVNIFHCTCCTFIKTVAKRYGLSDSN